jgi:hypothetical protein
VRYEESACGRGRGGVCVAACACTRKHVPSGPPEHIEPEPASDAIEPPVALGEKPASLPPKGRLMLT